MSTTGWVVVGVIVVIVIWAISVYNGLVAMRQRTNQAFADIDVQLKLRHDLIPNLVETVKGYAAHESGTLEAVIQARNTAIAAPGVEQKVTAENMLTGALGKLFALSENYPNLKANANFQQLQSDLSDIENKLAASRRFFNNAVSEYNASLQAFPAVLFATMFGFTARATSWNVVVKQLARAHSRSCSGVQRPCSPPNSAASEKWIVLGEDSHLASPVRPEVHQAETR